MIGEDVREMIEYYRGQGAPQDQQMLIALLREAQDASGGVLTREGIETIAQAYGTNVTLLQAMIKRVPGLRFEATPHRLEICGSCKAGAKLRAFVERTYGVKSGFGNEAAGFSYHVTPCMKNCGKGPSIRWDGKLYGQADEALIRALIDSGKRR